VVKSPQTNEPLSHLRLVPDTDLRGKINDAVSALKLAKSAHHQLKETGGTRSPPSCMSTADMSGAVGPKSNAATNAGQAVQRSDPFALVDVPARVNRPMIIRVEVVKEVVREV
jgi:hypothetical protein